MWLRDRPILSTNLDRDEMNAFQYKRVSYIFNKNRDQSTKYLIPFFLLFINVELSFYVLGVSPRSPFPIRIRCSNCLFFRPFSEWSFVLRLPILSLDISCPPTSANLLKHRSMVVCASYLIDVCCTCLNYIWLG